MPSGLQSSFSIWALSVLATPLGCISPLNTQKRHSWIISVEFIDFCPMLFFFLHSTLHHSFCNCWWPCLFNSNTMLWSIYSALLHLASLGAAPSCAKIFLCSCLWSPQNIFSPNQPWTTTLLSCFLTPSRLSQKNNLISELLVGWFVAKFAHSLAMTAAGGSPV